MLIMLYVSVQKIPLDLNQQSREASVPRTNRNADYGFDAYRRKTRSTNVCCARCNQQPPRGAAHLQLIKLSG